MCTYIYIYIYIYICMYVCLCVWLFGSFPEHEQLISLKHRQNHTQNNGKHQKAKTQQKIRNVHMYVCMYVCVYVCMYGSCLEHEQLIHCKHRQNHTTKYETHQKDKNTIENQKRTSNNKPTKQNQTNTAARLRASRGSEPVEASMKTCSLLQVSRHSYRLTNL